MRRQIAQREGSVVGEGGVVEEAEEVGNGAELQDLHNPVRSFLTQRMSTMEGEEGIVSDQGQRDLARREMLE